MKTLKSTLESFKENELTSKHKVKIYGGLLDGPQNELPFDEEEYDENGDPILNHGTGPRSGSTGGSSSATSGSSLGNSNTGGSPTPIGG